MVGGDKPMRTTPTASYDEPAPAPRQREASAERPLARLLLLPLAVVLALTVVAGLGSALGADWTAASQHTALSNANDQTLQFKVSRTANDDNTAVTSVMFSVANTTDHTYWFNLNAANHVAPTGWSFTTGSFTQATDGSKCPAGTVPCSFIRFDKGGSGQTLPNNFVFKIRANLTDGAASTDTWRVIANPDGAVPNTHDFSVTRIAIGVRTVTIVGPGDAAGGTITGPSWVNLTVEVVNNLTAAQSVQFDLLANGGSDTEVKLGSGNGFTVPAQANGKAVVTTFFFSSATGTPPAGCHPSGCGFSYNFTAGATSASAPRVLTVKILDNTATSNKDDGVELSFTVVDAPKLLSDESTLLFTRTNADVTNGETLAVISTSTQANVLRTAHAWLHVHNIGGSTATNVRYHLSILKNDSLSTDVTSSFAAIPDVTKSSIAPDGTDDPHFDISVLTGSSKTPDGDYKLLVTVSYNDLHTQTTAQDAANRFIPLTLETIRAGGLTVDGSPPTISGDPNLQSSYAFDKNGGNRVTIKPTVSDPGNRLDASRVNLTINYNDAGGMRQSLRIQMSQVGTSSTFSATVDFADFDSLQTFNVRVEAFDLAGNSADKTIQNVAIIDTVPPQISSGPTPLISGSVNIGDSVEFDATVTDNFGLDFVKIAAYHVEDGRDVLITSIPMTAEGSDQTGGSFFAFFSPTKSGTWHIRVDARDVAGPNDVDKHEVLSAPYTLVVTSRVDMVVQPSGASTQGLNWTADTLLVSQTTPAHFGTANATGSDEDPQLTVVNRASGTDQFVFSCTLLPETTMAGVSACQVTDKLEQGNPPLVASTITVVVRAVTGTGGLSGPINVTNGVSIESGSQQFVAFASVPATARPGEQARFQLAVASKFFPSATANVVLGYTVTEGHGDRISLKGSAPQVTSVSRDVRLNRVVTLPLLLENLGNTRGNFTVTAAVTDGIAETWTVNVTSSDNRFNPANGMVQLQPIGASSLGNVTTLSLNIKPGNDVSTPSVRHVTVTVSNATGDVADITFDVALNVREPTISLQGSGPGGADVPGVDNGVLSARNVTDAKKAKQDCNLGPDPENHALATLLPPGVCVFVKNGVFTFVLELNATSTRNTNPNIGFLRPTAVITWPDGHVDTVPMNIDTGGVQGGNGHYTAVKTITDSLGLFTFHLEVTDGFGTDSDLVVTPDGTFAIWEACQKDAAGAPTDCGPEDTSAINSGAPSLSNVVLLVDGQNATRRVEGAYTANYGSNITVRARLADNMQVGKATLHVSFIDADGNLQDVTDIAMAASNGVKVSGSNRLNISQYDGTFRPALPLSQGAGQYVFQVIATDAEGRNAILPNDRSLPIFATLRDLFGPTFDLAQLSAGGAAPKDNLDVERDTNVTLTLRVHDNGDLTPGSNVDPDSVKVSVRLGGSELGNLTLSPVAGSTVDYTLTLDPTLLTDTGSYSLVFTAVDRSGQIASLTRTLNVLVNLDPVVVVTSPVANADGVRPIGGTIPVVFTVTDNNVNETTGIRVEVAGSDGVFAPVTDATVKRSGANTITVSVKLTREGPAQVRVTATDTLGNATSETADVLVDATPPTGVAIQIDPFELTSGHALQGAGGLVVTPSSKFFLTATDAGGIGRVVVTAAAEGSNATRNLTLSSPTARFSLQDVLGAGARDGIYVLEARVADAVGNTVSADAATVTVDATAPTIVPLAATNPVTAVVSDAGAGVKTVEVLWGTSAGSLTQSLALSHGTGNTWTGSFPDGTTGTVFYKVRATDAVGNAAPDAQCAGAACSVVLSGVSAPPTVQLRLSAAGTPVAAGGTVRGEVSIAWTALNAGGHAVPVTLRATDSTGQATTLGSDLSDGPVSWDTTALKDGTWTITAVATDGALTNSASLQVVVRNLRIGSAEPIPANVPASGSILLSFDVSHPTRKVSAVVAVLKVGGQQESVTLFDDGTHGDKVAKDGKWSASYTPRLKGTYSVDLQVTYDDSSSGTVSGVATFQAEGNTIAPVGLTALAPVAVLAVLVIALGGFGIRRWK